MTFSIRAAALSDLDTVVAIDNDAGQLYDLAGLTVTLPEYHHFTVRERASWRRSIDRGDTFVAADEAGALVGFAALDLVDGAPYLDQLSVRLAFMRRGLGRELLGCAVEWARTRGDSLWLTTYGQLSWNRPFYEKEGFVVVPPVAWGSGMAAIVADQRRALPAPELRVVMRRPL